MKKQGFTLAEILITLGIVGVVAALTAPALVQNVGSAQVGPKLAKAVSTFEVANENMLNEAGAPTIQAAGALSGDGANEEANYINALANYMKVKYYDDSSSSDKYSTVVKMYDGSAFKNPKAEQKVNNKVVKISVVGLNPVEASNHLALSKDGFLYGVDVDSNVGATKTEYVRRPAITLYNKTAAEAHNTPCGTVIIDVNGKAKPNKMGNDIFLFTLMADGTLEAYGANGAWNTGEDKCNQSTVTTGNSCGASVLENDRKVIYN